MGGQRGEGGGGGERMRNEWRRESLSCFAQLLKLQFWSYEVLTINNCQYALLKKVQFSLCSTVVCMIFLV